MIWISKNSQSTQLSKLNFDGHVPPVDTFLGAGGFLQKECLGGSCAKGCYILCPLLQLHHQDCCSVETGSPFGREIVSSSGQLGNWSLTLSASHWRWEPMMLGPKNIGGRSGNHRLPLLLIGATNNFISCPPILLQVPGQVCNCAKWPNNFDGEGC